MTAEDATVEAAENLSARTISFGTASVVVGCRRRRLVMQKIVRVQRCRNRSEWQWRLAEVEAIGQIIRLRVGIPHRLVNLPESERPFRKFQNAAKIVVTCEMYAAFA